jgi:hypothetical protein
MCKTYIKKKAKSVTFKFNITTARINPEKNTIVKI